MVGNKLTGADLKHVTIQDTFWGKYIDLVDEVILPFQWDLINDRVEGAEKKLLHQEFPYCSREGDRRA